MRVWVRPQKPRSPRSTKGLLGWDREMTPSYFGSTRSARHGTVPRKGWMKGWAERATLAEPATTDSSSV